jgi:hypothetical protein
MSTSKKWVNGLITVNAFLAVLLFVGAVINLDEGRPLDALSTALLAGANVFAALALSRAFKL